jgi:hypothetical protein
MVPMSHRFTPPVCGKDLYPEWDAHAGALAAAAVPVPLRTGEAVVWDVGTIHHGPANLSAEPRVAVLVSLRPAEVELVHHRRISPTEAGMYRIDDTFFREQTPASLAGDPPGPLLRRGPAPDDAAAAADLDHRVDRLLAALGRDRADGAAPPPVPASNMAW